MLLFPPMDLPANDIDADSDSTSLGGLLGGAPLRAALGFRTGEAFRAALRAGRIQVPLRKITGRRGWFARTEDVADWQASLGLGRLPPTTSQKKGNSP